MPVRETFGGSWMPIGVCCTACHHGGSCWSSPAALATAETAHRHVIADFCAPPLRPAVVEEFRWFCDVRRALGHGRTPHVDVDLARFARARRAFGARASTPRIGMVPGGDVSLHRLLSPRCTMRGSAATDRSKHWRFLMCMPTWSLVRRRDGRAGAVSSRQTDRRMARGGLSIATCSPRRLEPAESSSQRRAVTRRAIWLSPHDFARARRRACDVEKAAPCAAARGERRTAERAGATPTPGPLRSPGSDPGGGRSCPLCQTAGRRRR